MTAAVVLVLAFLTPTLAHFFHFVSRYHIYDTSFVASNEISGYDSDDMSIATEEHVACTETNVTHTKHCTEQDAMYNAVMVTGDVSATLIDLNDTVSALDDTKIM